MKLKIDFRIYLVTNRHLLPTNTLIDRVEIVVKAGLRAMQIREKDLSAPEVIKLAREIRQRTKDYALKLFINDRADIARSVDADGLHIPEHGFPVTEARKVIGEKISGKSVHSLDSAILAESEGADYITFGPIYDTPSKQIYGKPQGLEKLGEISRSVSIPVFAIGGITPERAKHCVESGAYGVAVISDLLCTEDPRTRFMKYMKIFHSL